MCSSLCRGALQEFIGDEDYRSKDEIDRCEMGVSNMGLLSPRDPEEQQGASSGEEKHRKY